MQPGDRVLLQGPSGSGKSTLFRAFAGIWPFARGKVQMPDDAMFIPQRPYVPDGRLRDALAYPEPGQPTTPTRSCCRRSTTPAAAAGTRGWTTATPGARSCRAASSSAWRSRACC